MGSINLPSHSIAWNIPFLLLTLFVDQIIELILLDGLKMSGRTYITVILQPIRPECLFSNCVRCPTVSLSRKDTQH